MSLSCWTSPSRSTVEAVVASAIDDHGTIDVLVNNAGIGAMGSFEDTAEAVYRQVFETNVFGVIAMTQEVLPHMRAAGGGTIVNVGSIVGRVAVPFQPFYTASKHAIEALTDALHYETSPLRDPNAGRRAGPYSDGLRLKVDKRAGTKGIALPAHASRVGGRVVDGSWPRQSGTGL